MNAKKERSVLFTYDNNVNCTYSALELKSVSVERKIHMKT